MIDEEEEGGLRGLAEGLLGYGERQFDGPPNQQGAKRGVWAGVLLMCGQFERAVTALWEHQETEVEAVHLAIALAYHGLLRIPSRAETSDMTPLSLSPVSPPALSLSTIIWRYSRQFVKMDAKEALQYVYCVGLAADQGAVGKEQIESAWELARRINVLGNSGPGWEELVGGFWPDGTRFSSVIEQGAALLGLKDTQQFNEHILVKAARNSEENDRIPEAIKLTTLRATTARSSRADGERTPAEILRNYERTNRAVGRDRDAVIRLLRIREAIDGKQPGRPEVTLEIMESTELIPLEGDVFHRTELAQTIADKVSAMVEQNEKTMDVKLGGIGG
ncbi:Nucleoporin-interacting protein [Mycena kentingensis (nom. inval.)]|nr:Nucleoporin-interacting protein [Mycena kentingensis (nom. inval.)]